MVNLKSKSKWITVLIESDWNLKKRICRRLASIWLSVLIESDWNLKMSICDKLPYVIIVLIESDWNLKR